MVFYDVIPLLTLSSSCLSLLVNIIGKLYRYRDHDGKTFSKSSDNYNDLVDNDRVSDTMFVDEKEKNFAANTLK